MRTVDSPDTHLGRLYRRQRSEWRNIGISMMNLLFFTEKTEYSSNLNFPFENTDFIIIVVACYRREKVTIKEWQISPALTSTLFNITNLVGA